MRHLPAGATAAIAAAGGYAALYRLGQTWGATDQERQQALAGDELLPDARAWTTHAITIMAPAPEVWPWLVQMGWGRAGWYTYRWVDRLLFPANGPSSARILPEHQRLGEGDRIPDGPPTWTVGSPWSGSSRAGCWCCGRPGTCRRPGVGAGWRWSGSGAGTWTSRPLGGPGSFGAIGCAWTRGGSSGHSWPRSSRRTSSWPAATCAASGTGSRAPLRQQ